jgi:hypothetical protein
MWPHAGRQFLSTPATDRTNPSLLPSSLSQHGLNVLAIGLASGMTSR